SLAAYEAAERFFGAALGLADERDPVVALRYATAHFDHRGEGESLLLEARDELARTGAVEPAAEAELYLGRCACRGGGHDRALERYNRAIALLRDAPPSRTKAEVFASGAGTELIAGRGEEAIRRARATLAIAEELGLPDIRAGALITLGQSRALGGDEGADEDLRRGLELEMQLNSPTAVTGFLNLADNLIDEGKIEDGLEARADGKRLAERLGLGAFTNWLRGERPGELYMLGRWGEALALAEGVISWSSGGHRHYLEAPCRQVRAGILLARGDLDRTLDDAARSLELSREAKDPQLLYAALAFAARVHLTAGRPADGERLLDELLEGMRTTQAAPIGYAWLRSAALSLFGLGRGDEF